MKCGLGPARGDIFAGSPREKELLEHFHQLSPEMQTAILDHVKVLAKVGRPTQEMYSPTAD